MGDAISISKGWIKDVAGWVLSAPFVVGGWLGIALWASMISFAIRAWRFMGRWPSYDQPDPKNLSVVLQSALIDRVVAGVVLVTLSGLTLRLLTRVRSPWYRVAVAAVVCVVGIGVGYLLLITDPGGVIEWVVD